ncbi:MAG: leucyl aminopeptidase family protein, partial [Brevundimonas sp.]
MTARSLQTRLPAGDWRMEGVEGEAAQQAALAFALGGYLFDRYKARPERGRARLVAPSGLDLTETLNIAAAAAL